LDWLVDSCDRLHEERCRSSGILGIRGDFFIRLRGLGNQYFVEVLIHDSASQIIV
jgi:hypothetical protein